MSMDNDKETLLARVERQLAEHRDQKGQLIFRGFGIVGDKVSAELTRDDHGIRIPIHLGPGQEPTEEILLACIASSIQRMAKTTAAYKDFENKYLNRIITLPEPEEEPGT